MMVRLSLEGAVKWARRDLRRDDETSAGGSSAWRMRAGPLRWTKQYGDVLLLNFIVTKVGGVKSGVGRGLALVVVGGRGGLLEVRRGENILHWSLVGIEFCVVT